MFENTIADDVSDDRLAKDLPATEPWTFMQRLENELSALGFYISAHPLDQYKSLILRSNLKTSDKLAALGDRKIVQVAAIVNSFSKRTTKSGKEMLTINASDSFGNIEAVAFGENINDLMDVLKTESSVVISGKLSIRDERVSVFVDSCLIFS